MVTEWRYLAATGEPENEYASLADFRLWIFLACGSRFLQAKMVDTLSI